MITCLSKLLVAIPEKIDFKSGEFFFFKNLSPWLADSTAVQCEEGVVKDNIRPSVHTLGNLISPTEPHLLKFSLLLNDVIKL